MITHEFNLLEKQIRSHVIKQYLNSIGQNKCVCFSCGNASRELRNVGLEVIEVINPDRWWTFEEIQSAYKCFDATSGHLPIPLMVQIAEELRKKVNIKSIWPLRLPTGSGETFVCFKMAFPDLCIVPVYDLDAATQFNEEAPLNNLVKSLSLNNF